MALQSPHRIKFTFAGDSTSVVDSLANKIAKSFQVCSSKPSLLKAWNALCLWRFVEPVYAEATRLPSPNETFLKILDGTRFHSRPGINLAAACRLIFTSYLIWRPGYQAVPSSRVAVWSAPCIRSSTSPFIKSSRSNALDLRQIDRQFIWHRFKTSSST